MKNKLPYIVSIICLAIAGYLYLQLKKEMQTSAKLKQEKEQLEIQRNAAFKIINQQAEQMKATKKSHDEIFKKSLQISKDYNALMKSKRYEKDITPADTIGVWNKFRNVPK